jgi:hypothetical protein
MGSGIAHQWHGSSHGKQRHDDGDNSHAYELTYTYWCARLATGVTLASGDLRVKHDHLARTHLEGLLREVLASPVPGDDLKRSLHDELRQR